MCSGRVTDPISIPWTGTRPRTGGSSCSSQRCSHQRAASTVPPTWKSAPWAVPSFGSLCEAVEQGAGDKTVARNAQAACMEVSATTRTASVCAPLDSLVPAVSRPAERAVWAELPGAVPGHIRLPGPHLLPPGPLWLFLRIWLERKPVPGSLCPRSLWGRLPPPVPVSERRHL